MKCAGIILAGGKGTRINSHKVNKVTLPFVGIPLINYGVDLFKGLTDKTIIVVGAYAASVKKAVKQEKVEFAYQAKRLGTAHATLIGLKKIENLSSKPDYILVGYGDHMMFYKKATVKKLINAIREESAAISLITVEHDDPSELAWGRILRDSSGYIVDIVEQKDADQDQRIICELNAGLYCFEYEFLRKNIGKVKKSPVTGEYYINSLVRIAVEQRKKVIGLKVPFSDVGIGINRFQELQMSQDYYLRKKTLTY